MVTITTMVELMPMTIAMIMKIVKVGEMWKGK